MMGDVDEDDSVMICTYDLPTFDLAPAHAGVPELRVVELDGEEGDPLCSGGRQPAPMAGAMFTYFEMLWRA